MTGDVILVVPWAVVGALLAVWVVAAAESLPQRQAVMPRLRRVATCDGGPALCALPFVGPAWALVQGRQKPALRRLVVEIALACAFGWIAWRHGVTVQAAALSLYAIVFTLIILIDLDHHLILNRVLGPAACMACVASPFVPQVGPVRAAAGAAVGFALFLLVAILARGGLGEGDVKLAGFLGLVTGFPGVLATLVWGVLIGGLTTAMLLLGRRIGRRDYVPYGPFLIAGAVLTLLQW